MSKKKHKPQTKASKTSWKQQHKNQHTEWRTYNIAMPEVLIPIYDHLQNELNSVLADEELMSRIMDINTNLKRGDYWRALRWVIGDGFLKWGYGSNAWYARMIYENIRRIVTSGEERRAVHDCLVRHDNKSNEAFWNEIHEAGVYPKHGVVRNVQREIANDDFTACPTSATFVLDYTAVSNVAIERKISGNRWLFRTGKSSWLDMEILLPKNVRKQATGKIAKPRFMRKSLTGEYTGCVSYEVLVPNELSSDKILGVDLGKVKLFSASALDKDGLVSTEYIISKRTQHLCDKYDRVCESLSNLLDKQARCEGLLDEAGKFARRATEIGATFAKRRRLRNEIVRFVALDIVLCALAEDCGCVHIERLSWLDSVGGSWNHAELQGAVMELAPLFGLRVCRVDAAYSSCVDPVSGVRGIECDRDVVFDGWVVDRDYLATVNLACRSEGDDEPVRKVDGSFHEARPRRARRVCRKSRSRRCRGVVEGESFGLSIDYYELLKSKKTSRFPSGGVDVVAFSAGRGGLSPARSIKVTANTENQACKVAGTNKTSNLATKRHIFRNDIPACRIPGISSCGTSRCAGRGTWP